MLIIPFFCSQRTHLSFVRRNIFSPRLPTKFYLGLFYKKVFWQVTQTVECRSVKAKVTGSNPVLSAKFIFGRWLSLVKATDF